MMPEAASKHTSPLLVIVSIHTGQPEVGTMFLFTIYQGQAPAKSTRERQALSWTGACLLRSQSFRVHPPFTCISRAAASFHQRDL